MDPTSDRHPEAPGQPPADAAGSPAGGDEDATVLLQRIEAGDEAAAEALLPLVYAQLRAMAGRLFQAQRNDHTLQPTALVHEAYLKLIRSPSASWHGQAHFCAVAATAMRQVLQNHARARRAAKRGGDLQTVAIGDAASPAGAERIDTLALDDALDALAEIDRRGARIVELRFFGGLGNEEIAELLGISRPTVERAWRRCRAWLKARLADHGVPEEAPE